MDSLDLADFAALTPAALDAACQRATDNCDAAIAALVVVPPAARTFANTLLALEEAVDVVAQASGVYGFMGSVSADDALREAARAADQRLDQYLVALGFREDLYAALGGFAGTAEAPALTGEDARLLAHTLRDYRRRGFELDPTKRARVKEIFDELVALGVQFRNAIDDWDDAIELTRDQLAGLPESYVASLKTTGDGAALRYRVSLDYPELFPFLGNAESEAARRQLFLKDQRKGGGENVRRIERALALRQESAALLGYKSWADYQTEVRMAGSEARVRSFLDEVGARLGPKADADLAALRALKRSHSGAPDADIHIWDWRFYNNQLLKTRYAIDEFAVAEYFPLDACLDGLFAICQEMLAVRFTPAPAAPRWHPDVQAFDVSEADDPEARPIARFYMDLFPRPNKFGHAAAFTMRRGRRRPGGSYQRPVSAIVANFTKPGEGRPSLLRHSEVVTLFHEFGHILHQVLTRVARARFSGTATERDFVEAPSQMLEHWCWEPQVLGRFARHHKTGEPLPEALLGAMIAAKNVSSGIIYRRQFFFAMLDITLHSPAYNGDSTNTVARLHQLTGFPFPEGTHFQSGFGHLFGYDAGYYGYLWSRVFGDDMYTRFEKAGPLDRATGLAYRQEILERGGTIDGDELVRSFLGREPENDAFLRGLGLYPDS